MLFVDLQPYHVSFNLFGQKDNFHGWSGTRRNTDYGELRGHR